MPQQTRGGSGKTLRWFEAFISAWTLEKGKITVGFPILSHSPPLLIDGGFE